MKKKKVKLRREKGKEIVDGKRRMERVIDQGRCDVTWSLTLHGRKKWNEDGILNGMDSEMKNESINSQKTILLWMRYIFVRKKWNMNCEDIRTSVRKQRVCLLPIMKRYIWTADFTSVITSHQNSKVEGMKFLLTSAKCRVMSITFQV